MSHYLQLLSLHTPEGLRQGIENCTRYNCNDFSVHIFETYESTSHVEIQHQGFSISSMIRGRKKVYSERDASLDFMPAMSLFLPNEEVIFADFPEASEQDPVQCATILLSHESLMRKLDFLNKNYPDGAPWDLEIKSFLFENDAEIVQNINQLLDVATLNKPDALSDLILKSLLVRIIENQRAKADEKSVIRYNSQLMLLKKYIKENLGNSLNIKELMQVGNCSKSKLYRLFEHYCGKSPIEFIQKSRIEKAQQLLLNPDKNITEVAYDCGFNSVSYFSKTFKEFTGATPKQYVSRF